MAKRTVPWPIEDVNINTVEPGVETRVYKLVFAKTEKLGNTGFLRNEKPVFAAYKPVFSVLNFDLQWVTLLFGTNYFLIF